MEEFYEFSSGMGYGLIMVAKCAQIFLVSENSDPRVFDLLQKFPSAIIGMIIADDYLKIWIILR